jgi:hypothetical protein
MERVVKRYLMHSQGDTDDDPKLNELEDLKQELQIMKYDIVNDLKKSKEENIKNANMLNNSLHFVAEEVVVGEDDFDDQTETCSYLKFQESLLEGNSVKSPADLNLSGLLARSAFVEDVMNNGDSPLANHSPLVLNNSTDENLFEKKSDKFIHNSFFDNLIDNFHSNDLNNDPSDLNANDSAVNNNAMMMRRANRYKVTFDFDDGQHSRGLYKISEESSNAERTSEISKSN